MKKELINKAQAMAVLSDRAMDATEDGFLYFQEVSDILRPDRMQLKLITVDDPEISMNAIDDIHSALLHSFTPRINYYINEDGEIVIMDILTIKQIANEYNPKNAYQKEIYKDYINEINVMEEAITIDWNHIIE